MAKTFRSGLNCPSEIGVNGRAHDLRCINIKCKNSAVAHSTTSASKVYAGAIRSVFYRPLRQDSLLRIQCSTLIHANNTAHGSRSYMDYRYTDDGPGGWIQLNGGNGASWHFDYYSPNTHSTYQTLGWHFWWDHNTALNSSTNKVKEIELTNKLWNHSGGTSTTANSWGPWFMQISEWVSL